MDTTDQERRAEKVRENRLRRMAERQGLRLHKSRIRDPRALDYGLYWLTDVRSGFLVYGRVPGDWGTHHTAGLDDIEAFLRGDWGTHAASDEGER